MFKFTVIPFSAVPCRQFHPPGRDIPLTVIDYTLSMCGFPDKKTRFVLTKNPSHKSRYYNFFLAGIPKRINRLPGCCLVSRIQVKKYTDHQRHGVGDTGHGFHDLWLIHNGKSVFVLLKAFHQELCKRIFCQVQITGTHNCLGKVPFFRLRRLRFRYFFLHRLRMRHFKISHSSRTCHTDSRHRDDHHKPFTSSFHFP